MPTIPRINSYLNLPYYTGEIFQKYFSDRGKIYQVFVRILQDETTEYCSYNIYECFCKVSQPIETSKFCPRILFYDHVQNSIYSRNLESTDFYV